MPIERKRSIPGIGEVWSSAGAFVKHPYRVPALRTILLRIKELIYANQVTIFEFIEDQEGITLPREDSDQTYYFHTNSIHTGTDVDPNKHALWIDGKKKVINRTNGRLDEMVITIYSTFGSDSDFDTYYQYATCVNEALMGFFDALPGKELVYNWPANIASDSRPNYQPTVTIKNIYQADPDEAQGVLAQRLGAIPTLVLELSMLSKEHK